MPPPSTNLCQVPIDVSYTPGGSSNVHPVSPGFTANGGTVVTLGVTSTTLNGGSGGQATQWRTYRDGSYIADGPIINVPSTGEQISNYTLPGTGSHTYMWNIWTDSNAYGVNFHELWISHPVCTGTTVPCQYGTELTIPGQAMYYLSPLVIDAICISFGAPWAAVFFTAFWFTAIDATELCSDLPPPPPEVSLATMSWAPAQLLDLLHSMAWWYFCKCTAGATTPVTPPKPPLIEPPGLPVVPAVTCDPANICASLIAIQKQLAALAQTVGQDYSIDTLMQRYDTPFSYIAGAVHSVLPSSGSFAISRLIGMRAELVGTPPSYVLEGTPPYLWNLGWMSMSDGGGMLQEKRVTRTSMDWLPPHAQLATTFGYYMKPGATLRFTELQAEP